MATVKVGLTGISAVDIVPKAQGIHDKMNGNVLYPNPLPTPAAFQTLIDELAEANAQVSEEGSKSAHLSKRNRFKALRAAMKEWGGYVQMVSGGDATKILSSGFDVAKRGSPVGELNPPLNLGARVTNMTGRVSLRWERQEGADMHHVFMSTSNDPLKWELVGATTKSRFNADSLAPGTFYWFAVTALGAAGESSLSEPARVMAAA